MGGCFCLANATAREKVIRIFFLQQERAISMHSTECLPSLSTLECAAKEVCERRSYAFEPDRASRSKLTRQYLTGPEPHWAEFDILGAPAPPRSL